MVNLRVNASGAAIRGINPETGKPWGVDSTRDAIKVIQPQDQSNVNIYDGTAVWANDALINTIVNKDITLPTTLQPNGMYEIIIDNVSADTALTVVVKGKETFGETAKYPTLTTFTVAASTTKAYLVEGWMIGEAGRLSLSNDTALGAAAGFTANIRVRKV
jgi:hypothetical protein